MSPELPRPERGSGDKKPKPLPERSRVWGRSREGPRGVRSPRSPQRREYLFTYLFHPAGVRSAALKPQKGAFWQPRRGRIPPGMPRSRWSDRREKPPPGAAPPHRRALFPGLR